MLKSFANKLAGEAIITEIIQWNNRSTSSNICRNVWVSSFAALFRHWPTIFSLLISSVTASCCACSVVTGMFPLFNVARPRQLSSTHFKYFTSFFVLYLTYSYLLCSYLNPVLHGNVLTFAITCTVYSTTSRVGLRHWGAHAKVHGGPFPSLLSPSLSGPSLSAPLPLPPVPSSALYLPSSFLLSLRSGYLNTARGSGEAL